MEIYILLLPVTFQVYEFLFYTIQIFSPGETAPVSPAQLPTLRCRGKTIVIVMTQRPFTVYILMLIPLFPNSEADHLLCLRCFQRSDGSITTGRIPFPIRSNPIKNLTIGKFCCRQIIAISFRSEEHTSELQSRGH